MSPMLRTLLAGLAAAAAATGVIAQSRTQAPVSALKGHNSNAPVDVQADRIEVQDRADRAVFAGNVHAVQGDLTLDTQRLTVAYTSQPAKPGSGQPAAGQQAAGGTGIQINRLDASGGVVVHSPSETATGDFGVYDLDHKLITLVGDVRLTHGDSNILGSRLLIDLTTGRAVVDGGPPGVAQSGGRVTGHFTVPQKQQH